MFAEKILLLKNLYYTCEFEDIIAEDQSPYITKDSVLKRFQITEKGVIYKVDVNVVLPTTLYLTSRAYENYLKSEIITEVS